MWTGFKCPRRGTSANCSEHSSDTTSFSEVEEFQPEGLINRELVLLCSWALWHIVLFSFCCAITHMKNCVHVHATLMDYGQNCGLSASYEWLMDHTWTECVRLSTMCCMWKLWQEPIQSMACLFHVSLSLLFTPLTMNMKNVLVVIIQWRSYLYVMSLRGVRWCLDCT